MNKMLTNLFYYKHIKLINLIVFFQSLNKICRRQKSVFRIIPAGKCFKTTKLSIFCIYNRLIVNLYIFLFNCLINIIYDVLLFLKVTGHGSVVFAVIMIVVLFNCVTGIACTVTGHKRQAFTVFGFVTAYFESKLNVVVHAQKIPSDCVQFFFNSFVSGKHNKIVI